MRDWCLVLRITNHLCLGIPLVTAHLIAADTSRGRSHTSFGGQSFCLAGGWTITYDPTNMRNVGPISVTSNTLPKIDILEYSTNIAHAVITVLYLYRPYACIEARVDRDNNS